MIKKVIYIFIGLVLGVVSLMALGSAFAGPKDCPPGQNEGCNTYQQKETGKIGCFPDNADPQGWIFLHAGCDGEKKKDPTETSLPVITFEPIPTTPEPIFPTPTLKPGSKITVVATKWSNSDSKTPTPVVLLVDSGNCPNDCMCLLVTQFVISNDLQRTQIANAADNARVCVKP